MVEKVMSEKEAEKAAIRKIQTADAQGCTFSGDEVRALRRVAKIVQGFDFLGGLGHFIKSVLMWVAFIVGGYLALKNGVAGWVSHYEIGHSTYDILRRRFAHMCSAVASVCHIARQDIPCRLKS